MNREKILKSVWARALVFLWVIVFPILFIAIPVMEMMMGDREVGIEPLWAFGVWILGPIAASVILKYAGNGSKAD